MNKRTNVFKLLLTLILGVNYVNTQSKNIFEQVVVFQKQPAIEANTRI